MANPLQRAFLTGTILVLGACKAAPPAAPPAEAPPQRAEKPADSGEPADPGTSVVLEDAAEEQRQYHTALETARTMGTTCKASPELVDVEVLLEAYEVLAPYEQNPERDGAIATLERCRQYASAYVRDNLPDADPKAREDVSSELQSAIREANKRQTKNLSVTVEGSKITIKKKGQKNKKDEKKALQGYCAMTSSPTVTRITVVTDEHGEMSCSPKFEFSKQPGYVDRRFGIETPLTVESTEGLKTPAPLRPPKSAETPAEPTKKTKSKAKAKTKANRGKSGSGDS